MSEMSDDFECPDPECEAPDFGRAGACLLCSHLYPKVERLRDLLARSVRVDVEDVAGGRVTRFVLGEDHVIAEWGHDDGVAADLVFAERPALEYGFTTTPVQRCQRMVLEMVHWPVLCAMIAGPGDGDLKVAGEQCLIGDEE